MKRCWDANPDKRPEMDEVVSMLEAIDTSKGGGMIPLDQPQGCLCFRSYRGPWKIFHCRGNRLWRDDIQHSGKSVCILFHWRNREEGRLRMECIHKNCEGHS